MFFVLSINDLPNCLNYSLPFIYTDDTKCLGHTFSLDTSDIDLLQEHLTCISMEPEQGPSVQFHSLSIFSFGPEISLTHLRPTQWMVNLLLL